MTDFKIEITASTVAWYAAIVATISALFSGLNIWRDSRRIKITLKKNMKIYPADIGEEDKQFLIIDIANIGRRPITITHVGFEVIGENAGAILAADSVKNGSREIQEGKSTSYLVNQSQIKLERLKNIIVFDATGKKYRRKVKKALK